jgi:hypothetical protein
MRLMRGNWGAIDSNVLPLKKNQTMFCFWQTNGTAIGTYLQASHSRSQTTFSISPSHLDSIFYLILVNSSLQILWRNKSILHPSNMHMPSLNMHMPGAAQVWHFFTLSRCSSTLGWHCGAAATADWLARQGLLTQFFHIHLWWPICPFPHSFFCNKNSFIPSKLPTHRLVKGTYISWVRDIRFS